MLLVLGSLPSKGWETTQQDVGDDSSCPDVHLKAIPAQTQYMERLNFHFQNKEENAVIKGPILYKNHFARIL